MWNDGVPASSVTTMTLTAAIAVEHRRTDELQVVERASGQSLQARREQADGARRVGHREHQHREQDQVRAHGRPRSDGLGGSIWSTGSTGPIGGSGLAARDRRSQTCGPRGCPASRIDRPTPACRSGRSPSRASPGTSRPTAGPMIPPATMPTDGLLRSATTTPTPGTDDRSHELSAAGDQADREPDHGGRKDDVDAEERRIRDLRADEHARERREDPREEVGADRRRSSSPARRAGRRRRKCAIDRANASSVEQVRHHGAAPERHVPQPRCEGGRVEQVAGIEQGRQQDDPWPGQATHDVPDCRELRRAGEDDRAHRDGFDGREARLPRRQAVDEPEPDGRDGDPERIHDQPSPAGRECLAVRGGVGRGCVRGPRIGRWVGHRSPRG